MQSRRLNTYQNHSNFNMKKVVIVGGGHAGIEAALAVARAGLSAT